MDAKEPMAPRDVYRAYLRGDLSPSQAEQAVQDWYSASQLPGSKSPRKD